ncbi:MAG: tripartite tricarboxylate transporter permease [Oscillospiraceae bacterium]|nr:tripartite tricarboxylate transporter permease [Oscillospiraceae bacterium]
MMTTILLAIAAAVLGGLLYTIVGIIPGTDETATMVPITIILVLAGAPVGVLFAWEIGIIVAMQVSHTIPTAMSALPGSTMAVPMVLNCSIAKRLGVPHMAMRKMASGSLVGTVFALPLAIVVALILSPLGSIISAHSGLIFTLCALLIAYMSSARWGAVVAVIPFAIFIQALQRIAVEGHGSTVFTSIFMGITIGPMIYELFGALIPSRRKQFAKDEPNETWLAPDSKQKISFFPNPFKQLTKKQIGLCAAWTAVSSVGFTMSPVGMTVLSGEASAGRCKELFDRVSTCLAVEDSTSNATYIAGFIIPLLGLGGVAVGGVAGGPAAPLFACAPRFEIGNNLAQMLTIPDYIIFGVIGLVGGALAAYPIAMHKARSWTELMLRAISHEALIGAFCGLVVMLAFYEAGILGVFLALTIGLVGGFLHTVFGVHTGVQFMTYYASSWIVTQLLALAALLN